MFLTRIAFCVVAASLVSGCIIVPIPIPLVQTSTPSAVAADSRTARRAVPAPDCARPAVSASYEKAVLAAVNAERAKAGLGALRASSRLSAIAHNHACDNLARQTISHTSSDGKGLGGRMSAGGYSSRLAAENTGLGFVDSPARMVDYWMNSSGHRANILRPTATEAGMGYATAPGARPTWVLNIARPK